MVLSEKLLFLVILAAGLFLWIKFFTVMLVFTVFFLVWMWLNGK